jgi:hypothetical protein
MNDVTVLEGRGFQGFFDNSSMVLSMKSLTKGKEVSKLIQICVLSLMNDP